MKTMNIKDIKEFQDLARPLIKYLNDKHDPHTEIIITTDFAKILSGKAGFKTEEYIPD